MKKLAMVALAALGLALVGNLAQAADQVSSATLSQCGLSSLQSLSDAQGMQIRAKGVVVQANVLVVYNNAPGVVSQQISQGGNNKTVIVTSSCNNNNYVQQNAINGCNSLSIVTIKGGKGGKSF